jgi:hypothetical protein
MANDTSLTALQKEITELRDALDLHSYKPIKLSYRSMTASYKN